MVYEHELSIHAHTNICTHIATFSKSKLPQRAIALEDMVHVCLGTNQSHSHKIKMTNGAGIILVCALRCARQVYFCVHFLDVDVCICLLKQSEGILTFSWGNNRSKR